MDFQDTMVNLLQKPEFMTRLTKKLAEMSLDAVEMLLDRGVDIINVCDDLGNADGLLMSPELFREFFLPWYDELTRRVHERGAFIHLHSHGNIALLLPDLAAIGIDIINPFDWEENPNLPELVKRFGKHFVFCGGCIGDLYRHNREEVEFVIRRACGLSKVAERGYILSISGITDALSVDEWNAWRGIVTRAREDV
jgi:uroporphyrinogen decarboxylase